MSNPNSPASALAPPPITVNVGVVAALDVEVAALIKRLRDVRSYRTGTRFKVIEGESAGKVVAVIVAGTGRRSARRASRDSLDRTQASLADFRRFRGGSRSRDRQERRDFGQRDR